jgi:hypothetical protein
MMEKEKNKIMCGDEVCFLTNKIHRCFSVFSFFFVAFFFPCVCMANERKRKKTKTTASVFTTGVAV